jgi:hypothetical protein
MPKHPPAYAFHAVRPHSTRTDYQPFLTENYLLNLLARALQKGTIGDGSVLGGTIGDGSVLCHTRRTTPKDRWFDNCDCYGIMTIMAHNSHNIDRYA